MAFELINFITELLRINCSTVNCTNYPTELEALFYVFFFPTVLVILFVFILSNAIVAKATDDPKGHKGLRFLFAIAIYIFIVLQGYFTFVVSLSKSWWIFTIILFGLWVFVGRFIGKRSGGGGAAAGHGGALPGMSSAASTVMKKITGEDKKRLDEIERLIDHDLPSLKKRINDPHTANPAGILSEIANEKARMQSELSAIAASSPELILGVKKLEDKLKRA